MGESSPGDGSSSSYESGSDEGSGDDASSLASSDVSSVTSLAASSVASASTASSMYNLPKPFTLNPSEPEHRYSWMFASFEHLPCGWLIRVSYDSMFCASLHSFALLQHIIRICMHSCVSAKGELRCLEQAYPTVTHNHTAEGGLCFFLAGQARVQRGTVARGVS